MYLVFADFVPVFLVVQADNFTDKIFNTKTSTEGCWKKMHELKATSKQTTVRTLNYDHWNSVVCGIRGLHYTMQKFWNDLPQKPVVRAIQNFHKHLQRPKDTLNSLYDIMTAIPYIFSDRNNNNNSSSNSNNGDIPVIISSVQ